MPRIRAIGQKRFIVYDHGTDLRAGILIQHPPDLVQGHPESIRKEGRGRTVHALVFASSDCIEVADSTRHTEELCRADHDRMAHPSLPPAPQDGIEQLLAESCKAPIEEFPRPWC